ncbi:MAG: SH3 domain-containing protein [Clostridia bacterium]|nr:SH3 domain-containing protein [Clostridia bacterium]
MTNKNLKPVIAVAGVSLAVSLVFTGLVGCKNNPGSDDETTTLPSIYESTSDPVGSNSGEVTTDEVTTAEETEPEYTEVNETVYVTVASVNIRKGPGTKYDSIGVATEGQTFTRVKHSASWSVVLVEGEEYYISSDCLSTTNPSSTDITFEPIDKVIYVTVDNANVRTKPNLETSEIKYVAVKDQALTAIGISSDKKWYKINYLDTEKNEEHVLYISASVVTAEKAGSDFLDLNKKIVVLQQIKIRNYPSFDDKESLMVAVAVKDQILDVVGVSPDGNIYMIKYKSDTVKEGFYFVTANPTYVKDVESSSTVDVGTTAEADVTTADPSVTTAG